MPTSDEGRRLPAGNQFRVIGIRPDASRVVIAERLSQERAIHIRELLLVSRAFPEVIVECETGAGAN